MIERNINGLKLLVFKKLSSFPEITSFVTTGKQLSGEEFNLSYKTGDSNTVKSNRDKLSGALSINESHLIFPEQTHSSAIGEVKSSEIQFPSTDALITNTRGIGIAVLSADCVPVLIYDPVKRAAAAVHAGWRGTVDKIVEKTIQKMKSHYNSSSENLIVCIGPSISQDVYEVGEEVINEVNTKFKGGNNFLKYRIDENKACLDLWKLNAYQAELCGVSSQNIEISGLCTFTHSHLFYSARKSGFGTGRFAAGILIKD